jgi:hypothetical protein
MFNKTNKFWLAPTSKKSSKKKKMWTIFKWLTRLAFFIWKALKFFEVDA